MSVTSGFFDSVSGDRKYNTKQFSSLFDGVIADGIFATIGNAFKVRAAGGLSITVDTGKAWFNHTWTLNDALLPLTAEASDILLNRIDAVVLDINSNENTRKNSIRIIKGTPATNPSRPALASSALRHQYALAYIYRAKESTAITQGNITSVIGSSATPFVTGLIDTIDITMLLSQFEYQANQLLQSTEGQANTLFARFQTLIEQTGSQVIPDLSVTRVKLASDALYSPISNASASRAITASDLGKTVSANASGVDFNFTLSKAEFDSWPTGFEFALCWVRGNSVKLSTDTGLYVAHENYPEFFTGNITNAKVVLSNRFSMVAFKKVSSNVIFITGSVEVTT